MIWLLVALGCGKPAVDTEDTSSPEMLLAIDPVEIDFGSVPLGGTQEIQVELANHGSSDLFLADLVLSSAEVTVVSRGQPQIAPGAVETVSLAWSPTLPGSLGASLDLQIGTSVTALDTVTIPVAGTADGPALSVSLHDYDFGQVSVGCEREVSIVIANGGNSDLAISDIGLTNEVEFTLDGNGGDLPALPWLLGPAASTSFKLVFTPADEHATLTAVQITTDDPIAPVTNIPISANGIIEGQNSMSWDVVGKQAVTGIFVVNEVATHVTYGMFNDRFEDAMPTFFQVLLDSDVDFRIALVVSESGSVYGDIPFVDRTFSVDEAVAAAVEMLDGTSNYGDNDTSLATMLASIDENADWLLDEDEQWLESKLNFVGINSDVEQSGGDYVHYIDEYLQYKAETDWLMVHGIAGNVPGGCSGAEPSQGLHDAAEATGGVFLSICESDWTEHMDTLAHAMLGVNESFVLEGNPAPASIEVKIDGNIVSSGWEYNEKLNSIVFDRETYPMLGSELRVDYLMAVSCE
jgi:hypothetical protein